MDVLHAVGAKRTYLGRKIASLAQYATGAIAENFSPSTENKLRTKREMNPRASSLATLEGFVGSALTMPSIGQPGANANHTTGENT